MSVLRPCRAVGFSSRDSKDPRLQVYWLEWSFGWCEEGSGVYMVADSAFAKKAPSGTSKVVCEVFPGQSTLGTFRERVPLGRTPLSPDEAFDPAVLSSRSRA